MGLLSALYYEFFFVFLLHIQMRLPFQNDNLEKELDRELELFKQLEFEQKTEEIINDENIPKIDLVRALIDTNDKNKARELLEKIVETGSEEEKHEARLLYMQIK